MPFIESPGEDSLGVRSMASLRCSITENSWCQFVADLLGSNDFERDVVAVFDIVF